MGSGTGGPRIGANYHYPLMKTADICALPVREWSEDNAHLYLWTTNAAFPDALKVIESWGFKYITCITWVKNGIGIGQYFRGKSEHCLFARRGMLPYKVIDGKRQQGVTAFLRQKIRSQQETGRNAKNDRKSELWPLSGDVRQRAARGMGRLGK